MTPHDLGNPGPARVIAVVRAHGSPQLPRVLAAVAAQTRPPDVLVGVRAAGPDEARSGDGRDSDDPAAQAALRPLRAHCHDVVDVPADALVGTVVAAALASECCAESRRAAPGRQQDWLWLLDDDHIPSTRALELLLDAVDRAPRVAVAGVKHRTGPTGSRLLDAGFSTSRLGRRITGVEEGEVDQGQLDAREDVLAVRLPGALVRGDVWEALGGPDPAAGDQGADLDLCRRVRLADHRVVVVPRAVLTQHPDTPAPHGPGERRVQAHLRLTGARWWELPFVAVSLVLGAVARVLLGIATKEPRAGWSAARQTLGALARFDRVVRARRRAARTRVLPPSRLHPLLVGRRDLARWHRDRWQRQRRRASDRAGVAAVRPLLPVDDRPSSRQLRIALPLVTGAVLVAAGVLAGWRLIGPAPVASTAWAPAPDSTRALWDAARSDWVAVGVGSEGPGDALWWALSALGLVFGSPSTAVTALLVAAPVLAGASAWWATGALTRSPWWRAVAALTWAATPALLVSLGDARVGAVLAHVAMPLVVRAVAQSATGPHRRAAWAWSGAASLVLLPVTAGAPALLLPAVLALLVVSVLAYRVSPAFAALPSLVLAAPNLLEALRRPALLAADPGLPSAGSAGPWSLRGWEPLLGWPGSAGQVAQDAAVDRVAALLSLSPGSAAADAVTVLVWASAALPLLLAVCALPLALRGGPRGSAVRTGLVLAGVGLLGALASSRVEVGVGPGGPVTGWTGTSAALVLLGLAVAGVGGLAGLPAERRARQALSRSDAEKASAAAASGADPDSGRTAPRRRLRAVSSSPAARHGRRAGAVLLTVAALVLPVAGLVGWSVGRAWAPVPGEAAPGGEPVLPAVIADAASSPDQVRTLALAADPSADLGDGVPNVPDVRASLLRGDGPRLDRVPSSLSLRAASSTGPDPARDALDRAVAAVLSVDATAPPVLAPFGIGFVVLLTPDEQADDPRMVEASERLAARLDSTSGLSRSGTAGRVLAWRVDGLSGQGASAPDRPAAVRVVTETGWQVLPSTSFGVDTVLPAGEADVVRTLVLADRADDDWRATLDGVPLQAVTVGEWAQGFTLPPQGGDLVVAHRTDSGATWHWALLATVVLAVLVAVPVRRGGPARSRG